MHTYYYAKTVHRAMHLYYYCRFCMERNSTYKKYYSHQKPQELLIEHQGLKIRPSWRHILMRHTCDLLHWWDIRSGVAWWCSGFNLVQPVLIFIKATHFNHKNLIIVWLLEWMTKNVNYKLYAYIGFLSKPVENSSCLVYQSLITDNSRKLCAQLRFNEGLGKLLGNT